MLLLFTTGALLQFTTPLPPTNVVVSFEKSFSAIIKHWKGGRDGGYFEGSSKCYEGVIIMVEKMPFRVNVSTTFDTYRSTETTDFSSFIMIPKNSGMLHDRICNTEKARELSAIGQVFY